MASLKHNDYEQLFNYGFNIYMDATDQDTKIYALRIMAMAEQVCGQLHIPLAVPQEVTDYLCAMAADGHKNIHQNK